MALIDYHHVMRNWLNTWIGANAKTPAPTLIDDGGPIVCARDVELHLWELMNAPPASTGRRIYLHKDRRFLSALTAVVDPVAPKRIVEVGIFDGGSTIYWAERYRAIRLVAFDIAPRAPHLVQYIERHNLADTIRIHFGTAQDDTPTLRAAMTRDFGNAAVDFIVDDASHWHSETRATLECLFPYLRAGGVYVVEDWAWAHHKNWPAGLWAERPLMSRLLSELMLVCGSGRGVIDRMEIDPNFAALWRGTTPLPTDGSFRLADHYVARDFPVIP